MPLHRVVILVVACSFLAGAVAFTLSERSDDAGGNEVDTGFLYDMISHHEQAVTMALLEVERGAAPAVRNFAKEILIFQEYEIGRMEGELIERGHRRADRPEEAMGWMGMGMPLAEMPGLASDEQLDRLRAAKGEQADALFLELMATHHRGGLHMARYEADHGDDPDIKKLAALMYRNQATEINEYRQTAERLDFDVEIAPVEIEPASSDSGGGHQHSN